LMTQLEHAVNIFEHLFPNAVGVWAFDCSSAHEGFAPDALNVNNMGVNPGGKQSHMRRTVIPLDNPPPPPGSPDTRGQPQDLVFADDHPDKDLRGKPKGMRAVVKERTGVWAKLVQRHGSEKGIVGKCKHCSMSQVKKDAIRRLQKAQELDNPDGIGIEDIEADDIDVEINEKDKDEWCCLHRVLSLQDDFKNEKPMIWHYLTKRGHCCVFYPKFHCELNAIEMLWGYAKYREYQNCIEVHELISIFSGYRQATDGKFKTAKDLVPQCLDMADTYTVRRFFRKAWR
jgi:hypothetical protein